MIERLDSISKIVENVEDSIKKMVRKCGIDYREVKKGISWEEIERFYVRKDEFSGKFKYLRVTLMDIYVKELADIWFKINCEIDAQCKTLGPYGSLLSAKKNKDINIVLVRAWVNKAACIVRKIEGMW